MNWYKKAQSNVSVNKEELNDRTRYWLIENNNKIGKLSIQSGMAKQYYIITAFKIDEKYRGLGYGRKLMDELLRDPKYQDKPIIVQPLPYNDKETTIEDLSSMYQHFGFKSYKDNPNFLILERNNLNKQAAFLPFRNAWILPNGEVINTDGKVHSEFVEDNKDLFYITDNIDEHTSEDDLHYLAYRNGAVRIASNQDVIGFAGQKSAIIANIDKIKDLAEDQGITIDIYNNNKLTEFYDFNSFSDFLMWARGG